MSGVLRFVRLDLLTIKAYLTWKTLLVFAFVAAAFSIGVGSATAVLGAVAAMATVWVSYPFAVAEKANMDILYATLGLRRPTVVAGRYTFALLADLFAGIVGYALALLLTATGKSFDPAGTAMSAVVVLALFSLIQAIQFPIIFKVGFTRGRFLMYVPLVGFPIIVLGVSSLASFAWFSQPLTGVFAWFAHHVGITFIIVIVVWLAAMMGSYTLSARFYGERDF